MIVDRLLASNLLPDALLRCGIRRALRERVAELERTAPDDYAVVYESRADRFYAYWRLFFMAVVETLGYDGGREWGVSHYRFGRADSVLVRAGGTVHHRGTETQSGAAATKDFTRRRGGRGEGFFKNLLRVLRASA